MSSTTTPKLRTVRQMPGLHRVTRDGEDTGLRLIRGSYHGTTDDRADRWYVVDSAADLMDKRGPGHATIASALDSID